jgi:hypothetical protein
MNAKLLGAVTAVALLGSVGAASAQGPMQLTDAQLDVVTSGTGQAAVSAFVQNGNAVGGSFSLASNSESASASISTSFVPTENNGDSILRLAASVAVFPPL